MITPDKSDAADARRMRWLLAGNGYFMEEEGLCGCKTVSDEQSQDYTRLQIDEAMEDSQL